MILPHMQKIYFDKQKTVFCVKKYLPLLPCASLHHSKMEMMGTSWIYGHMIKHVHGYLDTRGGSTYPLAHLTSLSPTARTRKTLRIYARTTIEMHWFCVFSRPAGENTSFYRLLIKRFMDNWETSPNVRLALLCLLAVKTFFKLPFHIIYWHPVARLHHDPAMFFLAARSKVYTARSCEIWVGGTQS